MERIVTMGRNDQQRKNKIPRYASLVLVLTLITTCLLSSTLAKYTSTLGGKDNARVAAFVFEAKGTSYIFDDSLGAVGLSATGTAVLGLFDYTYANETGSTYIGNTVAGSSATPNLVAPGVGGRVELDFSNATGVSEVATRLSMTATETQAAGSTSSKEIPIFYEYCGKYYANPAAIAAYSSYIGTTGYVTNAADLHLNMSNTDTTAAARFGVTLNNSTYGGDLDALAAASTTELATVIGTSGGVIPPQTSLDTYFTGPVAAATTIGWYWPFEVATENAGVYTIISDTYDTLLGTDTTKATIELKLGATLTQVD